jgi:hypothetical protein
VSPLLEALIPLGRKVADRPRLGDERDSRSVRRAPSCLITMGCKGFTESRSALLLLSHPRPIVSDTHRARHFRAHLQSRDLPDTGRQLDTPSSPLSAKPLQDIA